jgi:hypothetical protein
MAIGLALALAGCASQADNRKIAAAQEAFFAAVQAKQYATIYDNASPEFQAAASRDIFIGFMQRIDRKLGECKAPTKQMNWNANLNPNGYFVAQGYASACANGQLDQSLTIVLRGGEAKVEGYTATSPLLLTD